MPRTQTAYVCQECASQYPRPYGRCPGCGTWDSLQETVIGSAVRGPGATSTTRAPTVQPLAEVRSTDHARVRVPIEEFNRVLGGGLVAGSAILLGGDPGIGKSTLLLQVAQLAAAGGASVLYVTGEESPEQLRIRADRVGVIPAGLTVLAESNADWVIAAAAAANPTILIIDSIQTMRTADLEPAAGSVAQVRECTGRLIALAKRTGLTLFLVGHVTKDGSLAGPKVLEHMVDVVLYLEGDHFQAHRILRSLKNRYGATHEMGVFDMRDGGLAEVANPSALFLTEQNGAASGSAIAVTMEGTRPLLVEIQALSTRTSFGLPRRAATGIDINRLHMLAAVLTKRARVDISAHDIYVNAVGGLRLAEPAVDLATLLAIYSSHADVELPRSAAIGEVGLGGEIRPVSHIRRRLQEAHKLGLRQAVIPKAGMLETEELDGMTILRVDTVTRAIAALTER